MTATRLRRSAGPERQRKGGDERGFARIVDNATRVNQRVVVATLGTLSAKARAAELRGPSIVIVGTVVMLRDKLDWYAPGENASTRAAARPSHAPLNLTTRGA